MAATTEKRTPEDVARVIARNAVPDVTEALELMRLQGPIKAGDIQDSDGTVLITLRSGDAYEFARWVRMRAPRKETSGRSHG